MAVFEIPENPEYIEDIRKFETNDPGHADVFNRVVQNLVNNDTYLKVKTEQQSGKLAWFWNCGNGKNDTEKSVDVEGFRLLTGARIVIHFMYGNAAADFTMNVNGTGAKPVRYRGQALPKDYIRAGHMIELVYYGDCWNVVGDLTQAQVDALETRLDGLTPADIGALPSSGNAVSASKWDTARKINGMSIDGTADRTNYGVCSTSGSTAAKTVSCTGFSLVTGAEITVKFNNTNTASNPTLNVNGTGAKAVYYKGAAVPSGHIAANGTYIFRYNGTRWEIVGDVTQKQVDVLEAKISSLQVEVADLKMVTSALFEKAEPTITNGKLWEYKTVDYIPMNETSIIGAKCGFVNLEKGATYKVVTSIAEEYKDSVFAVMEVVGSNQNFGFNGNRINGTGAKDSFTIKPREGSDSLLINCCGIDSNIEVYKLKF